MKRLIFAVICLSLAACTADTGTIESVWSTPNTLKVPESIKHDPARGHIYVSNINGNPTEADDNGFISRLDIDGSIIDLKWIEGLSAPKGMDILGNRLYVTDITRLVEIDIDSGRILSSYEAAGAEFLNDVAAGDSGIIYVSDMSADIIYALRDGEIKAWFSEGLNHPNGLFFDSGKLYIGCSGSIRTIDPLTGETVDIISTGFSIDGLVPDGTGGFIASDWKGRTVRIDEEGKQDLILDTSSSRINSADIEYIIDESLLIIPTFRDNRAVAYRLENR